MLLNAPSRFLYLSQRGCSPHGALVCGHTWRVLPTQQPPTGSRVHHHLASASALLAQAKVSEYFLWLLSPYLPGQPPVHLGSLSSRTVLSCLPSLMSFMGPSSSAHPLKCGAMDPFLLSLRTLFLDLHIVGCIFDHTYELRIPKFVLPPLSLPPGLLVTSTRMFTAPHGHHGCIVRILGPNLERCRLVDRQEQRAVHPGFQQNRKQGCS